MDDERFDALSRVLGGGATRRGVIVTLAGMAGLGLSEVGAKKQKSGKRKRSHKRRGKSKGRVEAAAQDDKVKICHRTGSETNPFEIITVARRSLRAHADHGDLVGCDNPNQVIDFETCTSCKCPDIECAAPREVHPGSCQCVCPFRPCPGAQSVDQSDCECRCSSNLTPCTGLRTRDPVSCACVCAFDDITCPDGQQLDCVTCQCKPIAVCAHECPSDRTCEDGVLLPDGTTTAGCCRFGIRDPQLCGAPFESPTLTKSCLLADGSLVFQQGRSFQYACNGASCSSDSDCPCDSICHPSRCCGSSVRSLCVRLPEPEGGTGGPGGPGTGPGGPGPGGG